MNPALAELLHGAGLGDIVIPRSKFIREHQHLVKLLSDSDDPALKKEAKDQSEELHSLTGGTHRENVLRQWKLEDKPYNLQQLSDITSIPISILQEVYNRGIGAYNTQPSSVRLKGSYVKNVVAPMSKKLSKEQWAMARVYSFIDGNPKHDNDLRRNKGGFFNLNAFRGMPSGTKAILSNAVKPITEGLIPALGQVAEHIIPLIGKGEIRGGKMSKNSGFIRRLMAENVLKHQGQYKNPTWELHPDSTMSAKAKFEYKKLANPDQRGSNEVDYGASPFIQKHFGHARAVPFERKRGEPYPLEPFKSKRKPKNVSQESEEQKKARRSFVEQQQAEAEAQPEQDVAEEVVEHSAPVRDVDADEKEREREPAPPSPAERRREERRLQREQEERKQAEAERLKAEAEANKPKESALHNKKQYISFDDVRGLKLDGEQATYPSFGNIDSVKKGRQFMMASGKPFGSGWGIGTPAFYKGTPVFIFKSGDMYARPKHWSPLKREYLGHLTQRGELVPPTPRMEFERGLMFIWSPDPRKNYPIADGSTYRIYEEDGTPVNPIEQYEQRKREPVVDNKIGMKFKPIDEKEWDKILLPK